MFRGGSALQYSRGLKIVLPSALKQARPFTFPGNGLQMAKSSARTQQSYLLRGRVVPVPYGKALTERIGDFRGFASPALASDKVMTVQQRIFCEVGCNDDERGRGQELIVSVTLWEKSLRKNLLKYQPDFSDVEAQKTRAESAEWSDHAQKQLQGTHDNQQLSKIVSHVAEEGRWFTIEALADCIAREVLSGCGAPQITVLIDKPDALRKRGVRTAACEVTRTREEIFGGASPDENELKDKVMTLDQQVHCEIGCHAEERGRCQEVLVSITVWDTLRKNLLQHQPDFDDLAAQKAKAASTEWKEHANKQLRGTHNNASLAKTAQRVAEHGRWFTIEALADGIASEVLATSGAPKVSVRVDKPQALREWRVAAAACEVTRSQCDLQVPA